MAHGVEAVLADMRRRRSGAIAGMASLAGYRGLPRSEAYGATKAAEINMLESLRIDLRPLRHHGAHDLPGLRAHRPDRQEHVPDAVHARGRRRGPPDLPRHREGKAEIVFPLR